MVFANIDLNFSKIATASPRGIQASIKLLLEWMCVPILIVGMQLPQAVHCYWLAGSTYSYLQSSAIRAERVWEEIEDFRMRLSLSSI